MKKSFTGTQVAEGITARLKGLGLGDSAAAVVAWHLVRAEMAGRSSHGVSRLAGIIAALAGGDCNGPGVFSETASSVLRYDARGELGIAAVTAATDRAREVALARHVCVMAVTGYAGTTGVLGSYTRALADAGLVAFGFAGSEYAVAPHGGSRAVLGTNPVAVAFPDGTPFSADLATAAWSYGDLKLAMTENRRIPAGVVQDIDGNTSTDPHDADNGSQLPMAGHKGYALGLAVELLCGPLIGGKAGRNAVPGGDGALFIALRADSYRPREDVAREVALLFDEVRSTPKAPGVSEIRIPGDRLRPEPELVTVDTQLLTDCGVSIG